MPDPILEVARDARLEDELDAFGSAFIDAERIGESVGCKIQWLKPLFGYRQRLDSFHRECAELSVLGDVADDVEAALREDEPIGIDHVLLFAVAREGVIT